MRFYEQLFDWSRKRGTLAADVSRKPFMNAAAPLSRNAAAFNGTCNKSRINVFYHSGAQLSRPPRARTRRVIYCSIICPGEHCDYVGLLVVLHTEKAALRVVTRG